MVTYRILWTGGWDSTYMMLLFSRQKCILQPTYVINNKRKSRHIELEHMSKMIDQIRQHPSTKATIRDIIAVNVKDIPADPEITAARNYYKKITRLGRQYDFLARYAKEHHPLYIGLEKSEADIAAKTLSQFGKVEKIDQFYRINPAQSSKEINLLFENMIFPIFDRTEIEMRNDVKKWGYSDIMRNIWFCHYPIHGEPCGMCNPCRTKAGSGMEFLLTEAAQKRYRRTKKMPRTLRKMFIGIERLVSGSWSA